MRRSRQGRLGNSRMDAMPQFLYFGYASNLRRLFEDDSAATAIEYGLIAAGISVAIIAVVQGLGSKLNTTFTSVQNALN